MKLLGGLGIVAIVLLVRHLQRRFFFLQYLFFCRFPLLLGLFLAVILPAAMISFARRMIGNLAVLGPWQISLVGLVATLAAWFVMYTLALLLDWIPYRSGLGFYRTHGSGRGPAAPPNIVAAGGAGRAWRWIVTRPEMWTARLYSGLRFPEDDRWSARPAWFLLLILFLMGVVVWSSTPLARPGGAGFPGRDILRLMKNTGTALWGILAAFALRALSGRLTPVLGALWQRYHYARLYQWVLLELTRMRPGSAEGKGLLGAARTTEPEKLLSRARGAIAFSLVWSILYLAGYFIYHPSHPLGGPSLLLIIILAVVTAFPLTLAAAFFDTIRVPVLVLLVAMLSLAYWISGADHYYPVVANPPRLAPSDGPPTAREVYRAWRDARPPGRPLVPVVVTASGGGITAALWTAEVLTRIQEAAPKFGDAVVLLSTVSGGGLGGMYFIEGYHDGHAPRSEGEMERIRNLSGRSSLAATAWGFVYRDIWLGLNVLDESIDRGWALEQSWMGRLQNRDETLRSWGRDAAAGRRPVQIFNATAETGDRLLLMPMSALEGPVALEEGPPCPPAGGPAGTGWRARNFLDLHPEEDLSIVTAARLSATFPFVSPMARPADNGHRDGDAYHVGDGGYYDNQGVVSAIDFLRDILDDHAAREAEAPPAGARAPRPRVLLVQIRASEPAIGPPAGGQGFHYATIGPIDTLLNVRTTSQALRDDMEIDLLRRQWAGRVEIRSRTFTLGAEDAPLSWHLTRDDIRRIRAGWNVGYQEQAKCIAADLEAGGGSEGDE